MIYISRIYFFNLINICLIITHPFFKCKEKGEFVLMIGDIPTAFCVFKSISFDFQREIML